MNVLLDLTDAHKLALSLLLEKVPPREVLWALTGSAGLRLQGVHVPVLDLAYEAQAYARLGREAKAAAIRTALASREGGGYA